MHDFWTKLFCRLLYILFPKCWEGWHSIIKKQKFLALLSGASALEVVGTVSAQDSLRCQNSKKNLNACTLFCFHSLKTFSRDVESKFCRWFLWSLISIMTSYVNVLCYIIKWRSMDIIFGKSNEDSFSFLLLVHLAKNLCSYQQPKESSSW